MRERDRARIDLHSSGGHNQCAGKSPQARSRQIDLAPYAPCRLSSSPPSVFQRRRRRARRPLSTAKRHAGKRSDGRRSLVAASAKTRENPCAPRPRGCARGWFSDRQPCGDIPLWAVGSLTDSSKFDSTSASDSRCRNPSAGSPEQFGILLLVSSGKFGDRAGVAAEREEPPFPRIVIRQRNAGIVLDDGGAVGEQEIAHSGEIAANAADRTRS